MAWLSPLDGRYLVLATCVSASCCMCWTAAVADGQLQGDKPSCCPELRGGLTAGPRSGPARWADTWWKGLGGPSHCAQWPSPAPQLRLSTNPLSGAAWREEGSGQWWWWWWGGGGDGSCMHHKVGSVYLSTVSPQEISNPDLTRLVMSVFVLTVPLIWQLS